MGQGASSPEVMIAAASSSGFSALACTDTNGVYGAVEFQRAAEDAGIRPILGAHLVLDDEECVALAVDDAGWGAICRGITAIHWQQRQRSTVNGQREKHSPAVQPTVSPPSDTPFHKPRTQCSMDYGRSQDGDEHIPALTPQSSFLHWNPAASRVRTRSAAPLDGKDFLL